MVTHVLVFKCILTCFFSSSFFFQISGIRKHRIDAQILNLVNLQILHLSNNCIETIPTKLGELSLIELDLSSNDLHKANYLKDWDWCDGRIIQTTLQSLILSDNKVRCSNFTFYKTSVFVLSNIEFCQCSLAFSCQTFHINW